LQNLNLLFKSATRNPETQYRVNLRQISEHFLSVAVTAENILQHMMKKRDQGIEEVDRLETGMARLRV
jgi:hypothetical protein